jgi:hypothetical protein
MEYRSPVRLVSHASEPIQPFAPQSISRTKKKLLAEMALQDNQITLDGSLYTRNDVIQLLDGVTDEQVWKSHCTVYSFDVLLNFLEKNTFDVEGFKKVEPYLYDQRFVHFISPYFASSFQVVSNTLIKQKDFFSLACLLNYKSFILPEHQDDAYQKIRVYLDELIYTIKNLSWEKFRQDESILHFLFNGNWVAFFNKLPDSFGTTRDEFMRQMLNLIFRFQRKATWYYLHQCCLRLNDIECNSSQKETLKQYEGTIRDNANNESNGGRTVRRSTSSTERSGPSIGRIIFICIWLVLIFVRLGKGCDTTSSPRPFDYAGDASRYGTGSGTVSEMAQLVEGINNTKNTANFKHFLYNLIVTSGDGPAAPRPATGQCPLSSSGMLPKEEGDVKMTIRNKSGFDAVLLYFHDWNDMYKGSVSPRVFSVYIRNGEAYDLNIKPNMGRFNFVFGNEWLKMSVPKEFQIRNYLDEGNSNAFSSEGTHVSTLYLNEYFRTVDTVSQTFLLTDLSITEFEPGYDANKETEVIYRPISQEKLSSELVLKEKNGSFEVKPSGGMFVVRH